MSYRAISWTQGGPILPQLSLVRGAGAPLHEQLADRVRNLILTGELPPGTRLPATRRLARELGVARNVVVAAYEALQLEGYLEGRVGSGTRVPASLPAHLLTPNGGPTSSVEPAAPIRLSRRGERIARSGSHLIQHDVAPRLFRPGAIDPNLFPSRAWGRIAGRMWRACPTAFLPYGDPAGFRPLRQAIAAHLVRHRAVRCDPDRVLVTHGSQQALDLVSRLLLDAGDDVAVEDPGYPAAWAAFRAAGARLVPVPVDLEGANPWAPEVDARAVRLCYTTPSHQYPLGVTMSLERRLRLLDWARRRDVWIVEDDYDSEFRYASRPLPALQGLDRDARVIYVGTFSKVLAPGLRIGFLVLPDALVEPFVEARTALDYHPPLPQQAILAEFIAAGYLERHVAKLGAVYGERWRLLRAELADLPERWVEPLPGSAGLHLTVLLSPAVNDRRIADRALRDGIEAPPLSSHTMGAEKRNGLILGFGAARPDGLQRGVRTLRRALAADGAMRRRDQGRSNPIA